MAKQETKTPAENTTANQGQTPTPTSGETKTTEQIQAEADAEAKAKGDAELEAQKEASKAEVKDVVKEAVKEVLAENAIPSQTAISAQPKTEERNPDVIYAKRGDSEKTQFSKREWDLLGADKGGWVEDVEVPAEVKALEAK